MKRTIYLSAAALLFLAGPLFSEEPKSLKDETFVVETSDSDAQDSLDRISGKIDAGFAPEEAVYKSVHHGRSTMVESHEDAYDVTSTR